METDTVKACSYKAVRLDLDCPCMYGRTDDPKQVIKFDFVGEGGR